MDRHQKSRQAPDSHQNDLKDDRRTSHRHSRKHREPLADARNVSQRIPQQDTPVQSLIKQLDNPLSEERDYVRHWLAQTDEPGKENQAAHKKSRYADGDSAADIRAGGKLNESSRVRTSFEQRNDVKPTATKKRHNSSSDSSILKAPIIPRVHPTKEEHHPRRNDVDAQPQSSRNKKRKAQSSSSESSVPRVRHETFEKRPRHKTREDRYEPKKDKVAKEPVKEKRPSKKRVSKTERSKATRKAGEDLMRNFTSKSVGPERLTMRPPQALGLFNNGRASSPAKRRGIPDLAFSEMEFLQHSYRHAPAETTQNSKSRTKSREKVKRKSQKAHEEIADFFQPKRSALQEIGLNAINGGPNISKYLQDNESICSWQDEGRNKNVGQPQFSPRPQVGFAQTRSDPSIRKTPPDQRSQSYQAPLPTRTPRPPTSDIRQSVDENSYISWSESQRTPASRSNGQMAPNVRPESPMPDDIQRSIKRTGIFKDTGIDELRRPRSSEESASTRYRSAENTNNAGSENIPSHEGDQMLLDSPATRSSVHLPQATRHHRQSTSHEDVSEARRPPTMRQPLDRDLPSSSKFQSQHSHVLVQHFDPKLGWQQTSDHHSPAPMEDQAKHRNSELTAADRAEVAKNARIRPSSRLSATRAGKNDSRNSRRSQKEEAVEPATYAKAANNASDAREGTKLLAENIMDHRMEPMLQTGEKSLDQEPSVTSKVPQTFIEVPQAGPVEQKRSTSIPLATSAESRLQTPVGSNTSPEFQRAECISRLGLPIRGPSTVNRGFSPSIPLSRLTPITDPDPLFIRQLNEVNRGEMSLRYAVFDHAPIHSTGDLSMEYQDDMIDDERDGYLVDENDFVESYGGQRPLEDYQGYDDARHFENDRAEFVGNQRSWRPDLTPIREQSDEIEQDYNEDRGWEYGETEHISEDPYEFRPESQHTSHFQGDVPFGHHLGAIETDELDEDDDMQGFWRPQARY